MSFPYRTHPVQRFPWLQLERGYTALGVYLAARMREEGSRHIAIDGYSGVRWEHFIDALGHALREHGLAPRYVCAEACFQPEANLDQMLRPFLTGDPVFGRLYHGHIDELWDA